MSFYTSLTGLNAATAMLGVTSNNISNVGTTGFKRSRADFGDIFATSPLQKASSTVGQGVSLKQVSQEFSQGNISFSSNALDLAITGDGFFPLRSADGLQELFTRNGSFLLNEQFNVVNSSGQRLMAATVDSTGSANVNERVVLTIPQKTSGEAKQTSEVALGLNFPADAGVIREPFNRANPATYNKSTAFTVYDNGGNGYLATIYYVKTDNASQNTPFNKWQTHVFVGEDAVAASLVQATNDNGEKIYVNQYGQIKPYSEVKDELTTAKTQLFSLDELTDKRTSVAASSKGAAVSLTELTTGINFSTDIRFTEANLRDIITLDIDESGKTESIDLSFLKGLNKKITGNDLAIEMTNQLNRKFGDQADFEIAENQDFKITVATTPDPIVETISIPKGTYSIEELEAEIQSQLDSPTTSAFYDYATQSFKFADESKKPISLSTAAPTAGNLNPTASFFGISTTPTLLKDDGGYDYKCIPNGSSFRALSEQRYGMKVSYDSVNRIFTVSSGKTGDKSSINISALTETGKTLLGLKEEQIKTSTLAVRGIESSPAVAFGTTPTINLANNFAVDSSNNKFVVTVDGIKGTVVLPPSSTYSLSTFMANLEKGINSLGGNNPNGTPTSVNGVKVSYDALKNHFVFTTGTTGSESFIKISGSSNWGLETVEAGRGTTSTWINPTQHKDVVSGALQPKYIDGAGNETTNGDGFTTLPAWSPIYLDKGELTFDTGGNLVSPVEGTQLETVYLAGGKGALTINIDYSASTQFSSAFAVLSQSQDGAPEGDLVGVTIANDGLVSASFSNGSQKSLAKILLVNFSSPVGLRQIGDSSFLASAASGNPILGTAGSAGFGTLRAGATERANVDLTQELVDLITAQRNFQANAKAIETSSTMTSAIINLRS
ncbi:MAG: flagellar hook-basal body complex protein [Limnohabitans sp.]|jgi:flagellar hook-basal body protein|nr:flagellar hook-basal body complex protein [Limnohabitans sp.]